MNRDDVTICLVTRGDVDLGPIFESLAPLSPDRLVVYDNSRQTDRAVFGRYIATQLGATELVYVQDDDCVVDADAIVAAHEPGRLVANMPVSRWADYPDSTMVGWGAVFERRLAFEAFNRYWAQPGVQIPRDPVFDRTCDVVFSALTPRTVIDVGFSHLPWAETDGRMFRQPGHKSERDRVLQRCRELRSRDDDRRVVPA